MTNWTIAFISIMTLVLGSEFAYWNFAENLGEVFPDRSSNGYDWTNGDSHLDIANNMQQQLHRGLYNDGSSDKYAKCPSDKVTKTIMPILNSQAADYSIGVFINVGNHDTPGQVLQICSTNWYDLQIGYGLTDSWSIQCATTVGQTTPQDWFSFASSPITGWVFLNFIIWYDTFRPICELHINGVLTDTSNDLNIDFTHTGVNPYFKIGDTWNGWISHVVVLTPGQSSMSHYWSNGPECSPLAGCMILPNTIIPGDGCDITYTASWGMPWGCAGGQCHLTSYDWAPCLHCPGECSTCRYIQSDQDYQCMMLAPSLNILEDNAGYYCTWTDGYYFAVDPSGTPEDYWHLCNMACETCQDSTNNDCLICANNYFAQPGGGSPTWTCSTTCPANYYEDVATKTCKECHAYWETCSGSAETDCTSCVANASVQLDGTCDCNTDYVNGYITHIQCFACHARCDQCRLPNDFSKCHAWQPGWYLQGAANQTCQEAWQAGYVQNDATWTWDEITCHAYWETCSGSAETDCTSWVANASVSANGTCECDSDYVNGYTDKITCFACHARCDQCSLPNNFSTCLAWQPGWYLQGAANQTCQETWQTGYVQNDATWTWDAITWHAYCVTCTGTGANDCTSCVSNASVNASGTCECDTDWVNGYIDTITCFACHARCDQWPVPNDYSRCYACQDGYYLQGPTSQRCEETWPSGYVPNAATNTWDEVTCHAYWETCSGSAETDCLSCVSNASVSATGTCECDSDYVNGYVDTITCFACHSSCDQCHLPNDSTKCNAWQAGYYLQDPVMAKCSTTWPDGFATNNITREWDACHSSWATCYGISPNQCISCADVNASMTAIPPDPQNWVCNDGYFDGDPLDDNVIWGVCHVTWFNCLGNAVDSCTECFDPNSSAPEPKGECTWNDGYYDSNPSENTYICVECSSSCVTWVGDHNICTAWATGFFMQHPAETSQTCVFDWGDGFYGHNGNCYPCNPICLTWEDGIDCIECQDSNSSYTDAIFGCQWNLGFYGNGNNFTCALCHASCVECDGNSNDECTVCSANAVESDGQWVCSAGYVDTDPGDSLTWEILVCADECLNWYGFLATECTVWQADYYNIIGTDTWVNLCPSGYHEQGWTCELWYVAWTECTGAAQNEWITCVDPNASINSENEWLCVHGYLDTDNSDAQSCTPCHAAWDGWEGLNYTQCIDWANGYYKQPPLPPIGTCLLTCPGLYTPVGTEWQLCSPACQTWSGIGLNDCTACTDGNASPPTCGCDDGYYDSDDGDTVVWASWSSSWQTCDGNSAYDWFYCALGFYMIVPLGGQSQMWWSECRIDQIPNDDLRIWEDWDPSWDGCTGVTDNDCVNWSSGFLKLERTNSCRSSCPDYYFEDGSQCLNCSVPCKTCIGNSVNDWLTCDDTNASTLAPGTCDCNQGYFQFYDAVALSCVGWDVAWESCLDSGDYSWITCAPGYFKQPPVETSTTWLQQCPDDYYGNETTGDWESCYTEWKTCTGPSNGECLTCDDANATQTFGTWNCSDGFFHDGSVTLTWQEWSAEWVTCVTQETNWLICAGGKYRLPTESLPDVWGDDCPAGYFADGLSQAWEPCHVTCENCFSVDANDCQNCDIPNTHTDNPGPWECMSGFGDSDSSDIVITWVLCASECEQWDGVTNDHWLSCNAGYFMLAPGTTKQCRDTWPDQYYSDDTTRTCLEWHATCLTCDATGGGLNLCQSCLDPNADLSASSGGFLCECANGYFDADVGDAQDCQHCHVQCEECTGTTRDDCTACSTGNYLQPPITTSTSCRAAWPDNYMEDGSVCTQCFQTCKTCTGTSKDDWSSCMDANAVVDGECVCVTGYYDLNISDDVNWIQCDIACLTCTGPGSTNCLQCSSNYYMFPTIQQWALSCPDDYYKNNVTNTCDEWFDAWQTCTGPSENQCNTCDDGNASLDAAGSCLWNPGYYDQSHEYSMQSCFLCDVSCSTWVTTNTNCLSCSVGYYSQPTNANECLTTCPEDYFASTSDNACYLCYQDCQTWSGTAYTDCLTCMDTNASVGVNGSCEWSDGYQTETLNPLKCRLSWPDGLYYVSPGCLPCHSDWATCNGGLQSNWITCLNPNNYLVEGICTWVAGYYSDPNDSPKCIRCADECATCPDGKVWYKWQARHAIPISGKCECVYPYLASNDSSSALECFGCPKTSEYNTSTQLCELECRDGEFSEDFECKSCSEHCTQWQDETHWVRCKDGYYVNNVFICASWYSICATCTTYETFWTSCGGNLVLVDNTWVCREGQLMHSITQEWVDPIRVSISVNEDNEITLSFSKNLDLNLTKEDLEIIIYTTDGKKIEFSYTLEPYEGDKYRLSLTPKTDDITEDSVFRIDFSEAYRESLGISPIDQTLNTELHQQDSEQTENEKSLQQQVEESTQTGSMALLTSSAFLASLSYNFGPLWRIINYLQLVSLFAFYNMSTTPTLDGFLSSLLKDSSIPNLYDYILPADYDTVSMPARFTKSNYHHPLIIDIFGHSCLIWLLIGVVLCVALIASNSKSPFFRKYGIKVKDVFVYNGLIRTLLQSSIYIFIGSFLTFKFGFANEIHSLINITLSGLALLLLFIFATKCYTAIDMNNGQLGEDQKKYKDLTKELKENTYNFSAFFNVIFLFRRAAWCAIVVFVEGPRMQILMSAALNTFYLLWLIWAQPFDSRLINVVEIFCESIIVITNFLMQNFVLDYEDTDTPSSVIIIIISIAIMAYFMLIIRNLIVKRCSSGSKINTEKQAANDTAVNITADQREKSMVTSIQESDLHSQNISLDVSASASIRSKAKSIDFNPPMRPDGRPYKFNL